MNRTSHLASHTPQTDGNSLLAMNIADGKSSGLGDAYNRLFRGNAAARAESGVDDDILDGNDFDDIFDDSGLLFLSAVEEDEVGETPSQEDEEDDDQDDSDEDRQPMPDISDGNLQRRPYAVHDAYGVQQIQ